MGGAPKTKHINEKIEWRPRLSTLRCRIEEMREMRERCRIEEMREQRAPQY